MYEISANCGAEGPTGDGHVHALRERQKRNFVATLMLSQGVPMLLGGDELSHSQQGSRLLWADRTGSACWTPPTPPAPATRTAPGRGGS